MNMATLLSLRPQKFCRNVMFSVMVGLSLLLVGCVYDPFYYGPPPHTHYYPRYYDYYYYPSAHVYFQFTTGLYFYLDSGVWVKTKVLPPFIHIDSHDRVRIQVDSDRPYLKFSEHQRIYTPRPNYRPNKERSVKEREANQRWYREYYKQQENSKPSPGDKGDKRGKKKPDGFK